MNLVLGLTDPKRIRISIPEEGCDIGAEPVPEVVVELLFAILGAENDVNNDLA